MDTTVHQNLKRALAAFAALIVIAVLLGLYFEEQILSLSEAIFDVLGVPGMLGFIFMNDVFISPVPPDLPLFLLAKSENHVQHLPLVLLMGAASTFGGTFDWFLASRFVKPTWFSEKVQRFIRERNEFVNKYGKWAVGIAALTPVPYSIVSWTAGFLKMDFSNYFPMALLRIPRFFIYYYGLVFSSEISAFIKGL